MTPLAHGYAQALLDVAPANFDAARFLEGAGAVQRAISGDARLKAFFAAPAIAADAKAAALAQLAQRAGLDELGLRFLSVVLANRRILHLSEILAGVSEEHDVRTGVVAAQVTVASPLNDAERRRLESAIARRVGRKVRLQVDVDAKTVAGFVAKVGSNVFDASLGQAIERFRNEAGEKPRA